jgi:hypothetical protein
LQIVHEGTIKLEGNESESLKVLNEWESIAVIADDSSREETKRRVSTTLTTAAEEVTRVNTLAALRNAHHDH